MRIRDLIKQLRQILWILKERGGWKHLVIHKTSITEGLPHSVSIPLLCRPVKNSLSKPTNLSIVLIHDYPKKPLAEKALDYVGIDDYIVLRPPGGELKCGSHKIRIMHDYLKNDCETDYVIYIDSSDAIIINPMEHIIEYLTNCQCDLLFSTTQFTGGYSWMPELKKWSDEVAAASGTNGIYINSGVYVGKRSFLLNVLEACLPYITDKDLPWGTYRPRWHDPSLKDELPEFPKGMGSDQLLFRYVHKKFYPGMKIDYEGLLALR